MGSAGTRAEPVADADCVGLRREFICARLNPASSPYGRDGYRLGLHPALGAPIRLAFGKRYGEGAAEGGEPETAF